MTHICVSKITIIGSDNGLSPGRRQAIIWTNARILFIWKLGTNFSEILSEIHTFSFKKMHFKMSSAQWRLFRLGLNVLTVVYMMTPWHRHTFRIIGFCDENPPVGSPHKDQWCGALMVYLLFSSTSCWTTNVIVGDLILMWYHCDGNTEYQLVNIIICKLILWLYNSQYETLEQFAKQIHAYTRFSCAGRLVQNCST